MSEISNVVSTVQDAVNATTNITGNTNVGGNTQPGVEIQAINSVGDTTYNPDTAINSTVQNDKAILTGTNNNLSRLQSAPNQYNAATQPVNKNPIKTPTAPHEVTSANAVNHKFEIDAYVGTLLNAPTTRDSNGLLFDQDWVQLSFMTSSNGAPEYSDIELVNRYVSSATFKFSDTQLGGNDCINPLPQFTQYCDIPDRGVMSDDNKDVTLGPIGFNNNQGVGMGRWYAEAFDDNKQVIHLRFGVPNYNSFMGFMAGFYSANQAQVARTGRMDSSWFTSICSLIGDGIALAIWPITLVTTAAVLLGSTVKYFLGSPVGGFYNIKPTMPAYWLSVTNLVNQMLTNEGVVRFMNYNEVKMATDAKVSDPNNNNFLSDNVPLAGDTMNTTDQTLSMIHQLFPQFSEGGLLSVIRVIKLNKDREFIFRNAVNALYSSDNPLIRVRSLLGNGSINTIVPQGAFGRSYQNLQKLNISTVLTNWINTKEWGGPNPTQPSVANLNSAGDNNDGNGLTQAADTSTTAPVDAAAGSNANAAPSDAMLNQTSQGNTKTTNTEMDPRARIKTKDGTFIPTAQTPSPTVSTDGTVPNEDVNTGKVTPTGSGSYVNAPGGIVEDSNTYPSSSDWLQEMAKSIVAATDDAFEWASFRVDYTGSISDSFSNSVTNNQVADKINSTSSTWKNLRVSLAEGNIAPGLGSFFEGVGAVVQEVASSVHLDGIVSALAGGAFVDIPKHWDSSSTSMGKSTYTMTLTSPYGNTISRMMNIYVPLAMLMAGALPLSTGKYSHTAPFMCQLFDRGHCTTRLGMIDSLSITRGTSNLGWTKGGNALAYEISFTVVDLNNVVSVPIVQGFMQNVLQSLTDMENPLQDYLMTLSGMDLRNTMDKWPRLKRQMINAVNVTKATWTDPVMLGAQIGSSFPVNILSAFSKGTASKQSF